MAPDVEVLIYIVGWLDKRSGCPIMPEIDKFNKINMFDFPKYTCALRTSYPSSVKQSYSGAVHQ